MSWYPLPRGSATSQEASASSNNIPSGEGPFQVGNNPTGLVSSQAGRQVVRHSARLGASQASQGNSANPQAGSASPQEATTSTSNRVPQGSSMEEPNSKWVINLSSKPLTPVQRSVLAKGPNFVVSHRHPPNLEYITAIETACTKLSQQDAEEFRADINSPKVFPPPKPNLTKAQTSALRELKRNRDHIVLTADKEVAMVIMDRQDYIN